MMEKHPSNKFLIHFQFDIEFNTTYVVFIFICVCVLFLKPKVGGIKVEFIEILTHLIYSTPVLIQ